MTRRSLLSLSACSVVFLVAASASADTYHHINRLAARIDRQARSIVNETKHYRHTPEYQCLLQDSQELCRLASQIRDIAREGCDLARLDFDLAALDAAYHHLDTAFCRVEQNAAYGYGHIHGNTKRVRRILNSIVDDIHHLQADLCSLRTPAFAYPTYSIEGSAGDHR